jgi:thioredoxin-related protein
MNLDELRVAVKKKSRPILIDVYTSWCGWCKVMDKETYSNEKVIEYINAHFYAVKFDAESTLPVEFAGKSYNFNARIMVNDLANYLLSGNMAYPTTVFFPSLDAQPAPLPGYMKPAELEAPLRFFGDGAFRKQNYSDYMKGFKASW